MKFLSTILVIYILIGAAALLIFPFRTYSFLNERSTAVPPNVVSEMDSIFHHPVLKPGGQIIFQRERKGTSIGLFFAVTGPLHIRGTIRMQRDTTVLIPYSEDSVMWNFKFEDWFHTPCALWRGVSATLSMSGPIELLISGDPENKKEKWGSSVKADIEYINPTCKFVLPPIHKEPLSQDIQNRRVLILAGIEIDYPGISGSSSFKNKQTTLSREFEAIFMTADETEKYQELQNAYISKSKARYLLLYLGILGVWAASLIVILFVRRFDPFTYL
jgi:hypothetical protein